MMGPGCPPPRRAIFEEHNGVRSPMKNFYPAGGQGGLAPACSLLLLGREGVTPHIPLSRGQMGLQSICSSSCLGVPR